MPRQPVSLENNKKHLTKTEIDRRANNERVVRSVGGRVKCPEWLDDVAKGEFNRLAKELKKYNILSAIDISALAVCCDAFSKWKMATEFVNKHGLLSVKVSARGDKTITNNPAIKDALRYGDLYRKMTIECGLTPNARMRLAAKDTDLAERPQDELFKFLTEYR